MRLSAAYPGILAALVACDDPIIAGRTEGLFRLCNEESAAYPTIEIDLASMQGHVSDVRTTARLCEGEDSACITFPMLLAVPPRLPRDASDEVRWSAGGGDFAIRQAGEGAAGYAIALSVTDDVPGRGRVTRRSSYDYHPIEGVTASGIEGETGVWRRCSGRLTFDDLRLLTDRLREARRR